MEENKSSKICNLMPYVEKVLIVSSYRSDHSGVILFLKLNTIQKGKGLWKFNNLLLMLESI